jgi:hypothetical protein
MSTPLSQGVRDMEERAEETKWIQRESRKK